MGGGSYRHHDSYTIIIINKINKIKQKLDFQEKATVGFFKINLSTTRQKEKKQISFLAFSLVFSSLVNDQLLTSSINHQSGKVN